MDFEKYTSIYKDHENGTTLRPGGAYEEFSFSLTPDKDTSYSLFAVGETALFYQWKNEPNHSSHYHSFVDALDTENAYNAQYALKLSSKKPEKYIRRIYKKLLWTPRLAYLELTPVADDWKFGYFVKAKELRIHDGGYLRMRLDVRYKREGVNRHSVEFAPDASYVLDFPKGSYDWREVCENILLPHEKVASVGVFIEGVNYTGEVYIERPFVTELLMGYNLLPDFTMPVSGRDYFDWTAQYLSRKEWPEFRIKLNGTVIFDGEVFERCHINSEWEVALPRELLKEENKLEIALASDYHDPLPYTVRELAVIEQAGGAFALVATEEVGISGGAAHALIRTEKENITLAISYEGELSGKSSVTFKEKGLHGMTFNCGAPSKNARFKLSCGEKTVCGNIPRIVTREEDDVITGTGDMIYVRLDKENVEEYLAWYITEGIGNLITIRPCYRWSGSRTLEPEAWEIFTRVINEWGLKYSHMIDGRELPGIALNPDEEQLRGAGALGKQDHERDGAGFYWLRYAVGPELNEKQLFDMGVEAYREDPLHTNYLVSGATRIYHTAEKKLDDGAPKTTAPTFDGDEVDNDRIYNYKDPTMPWDMKVMHDYTVKRLSEMKSPLSTRHTGPSVAFKYMLDAGYDWVGAESMYTSMEPLLSFLRGAAKDRKKKSIGVHHALQWASSPHDAPEHIRRYRLALYTSYMQGATEINTEEGLWRLEEYYSFFNRFSEACVAHKKQQQDFYRYVKTHTRRGSFYTPVALIHGRCDGWHSFGGNSSWGMKGAKDTDADKSWDILKVAYPESNLGVALYLHNCPTDRALGYYSSTPIANIDAIPIEARTNTYSDYKAIAFAGYNKYEKEDFDKLFEYVENGGKLMLTRAHMTETTDYYKIKANELEFSESVHSFTYGAPIFAEEHINGKPLKLCKNIKSPDAVIHTTDEGTPLICKYTVGKGEIILFNAMLYPANEAISELYYSEFEKLMSEAVSSEHTWAYTDDKVECAVYDRADGCRDIYFLAVDWYGAIDRIRTATLKVGEHTYSIKLPFGTMLKCTVNADTAVYADSENAEILSVADGTVTVEGSGKCTFKILKGGKTKTVNIDFGEKAALTFS